MKLEKNFLKKIGNKKEVFNYSIFYFVIIYNILLTIISYYILIVLSILKI